MEMYVRKLNSLFTIIVWFPDMILSDASIFTHIAASNATSHDITN